MILVYRCIKLRELSNASTETCFIRRWEVKEYLFFLPLKTGPFTPTPRSFPSSSIGIYQPEWLKYYSYKFLRRLNHQPKAVEPLWSFLNSTFLSTTNGESTKCFPTSSTSKLPPTGTRKCCVAELPSTTAPRRRAAQGSCTQRVREGRGEAAGRRYPAWARDARPE